MGAVRGNGIPGDDGSPWIGAAEERSNLSRSQFLIWLGQKLDPASPLYNMILAYRIPAAVSRARFEAAFERLVTECDVLRTVIVERDGVPTQVVSASGAPVVEAVDLSSAGDVETAYREWLDRQRVRVLDTSRCLVHCALVKLAEQDYVWYWNQHHVVSDAWSSSIVCARLARLYRGEDTGAGSPSAYLRHVASERLARADERHLRARRYWREKLAVEREPTVFYGSARGATTTRSRRSRCTLGSRRSEALRALARQPDLRALTEELSLFNLLATLVLAFVHRAGRASRISLGVPVHNRPSDELKSTIGLFMEVQPLTVELAPGETFATLHRKVSSEGMALLRHALPGTSTPESSRCYDVVLNFLGLRMTPFVDEGMSTEWVHPGHADPAQQLRIQVHDFDGTGDFALLFDCNEASFTPEAAAVAPQHFLRTVDALLADRDQAVAGMDWLSDAERRERLVEFNDVPVDGPAPASVLEMVAAQARAAPGAPALGGGTERLAFGELDALSTRLAVSLRDAGIGPGSLLPLLADRSAHAVIGMLGILKAGAAYVPLERTHPPQRLAAVLADVAAHARRPSDSVLVADGCEARVPPGFQALGIEALLGGEAPAARALEAPGAQDLAYVIYTSGSTGAPKGVAVSHGALANYVAWAAGAYTGGRPLRFALHSSLSVDLTVTSVFVPLASGGCIVAYPDVGEADIPVLRAFRDDAVDVLKLTPTHLGLIRAQGGRARRIRTLLIGGEELGTDLVRDCAQQFPPGAEFVNEYGPTECTVGCMAHWVDLERDRKSAVPIGAPIARTRVYVLDDDLSPAPTGIAGELCVGGAGVAAGYLGDPDLDAGKFVPDPFHGPGRLYRTGDLARWGFDGELEFLGRADRQLKVRGVRVEPAEIEARLREHPAVSECVVAAPAPEIEAAPSICARCCLSSDYPGIRMDRDGVCSLCREFETYADRTREYFGTTADLVDVAARIKSRSRSAHDCLVLLSGGKDSTYMLYQLVALGLKVLAFTLDNGFISDQAKRNIARTVDDLGIEHVFAATPHMNAIFVDSLEQHSNVCNGCFKAIYSLSMQLARERDIAVIVTGLSRGQIFETRLNELYRERVFDVASIEDAIDQARRLYHRMDDVASRELCPGLFADDAVFDDLAFVDFYRYCDVSIDEVYRFLAHKAPWIRPSDTGRSTNCLINDAGIHVHKTERGFHNYALPYSWDVRLGHKRRDEALAELDDRIDVAGVNDILGSIGYRSVGTGTGARAGAARDAELVAWFVGDGEVDVADLEAHLSASLATEMVPRRFVRVTAIPLTSGGKVDWSALRVLGAPAPRGREAYVPPATDLERRIAAIWSEVLGVERVGRRDDFFALGGVSLSAIRALSRLSTAFDVEVPFETFFRSPTVAAVSEEVESLLLAEIEAMSDEEIRRALDGDAS